MGFLNSFSSKLLREIGRLTRNRKAEVTDSGVIAFSGTGLTLEGRYQAIDENGNLVRSGRNLFTTEGANHVLSAVLAGGTVYTAWYMAPFTNDVTPSVGWTQAAFPATAGELTVQVVEATRPAYNESVPASRSTTNSANPATITAAQNNVVVRGVGLCSNSTKGGTTGVLLSAYKYEAAYTLPSVTNTLGLVHTITIPS